MSQLIPSDLGTAMPRMGTLRMSRKLLIIEDEEPLCQVYSAALCQADPCLEVVLAYNGEGHRSGPAGTTPLGDPGPCSPWNLWD